MKWEVSSIGVLFVSSRFRVNYKLPTCRFRSRRYTTSSAFSMFEETLDSLNYPKDEILSTLMSCGFTSSEDLVSFAQDFVDRPEVLSNLLIQDFSIPALQAHRTRAALSLMCKNETCVRKVPLDQNNSESCRKNEVKEMPPSVDAIAKRNDNEKIPCKAYIVNELASHRKRSSTIIKEAGDKKEYSLPSNYDKLFPTLNIELLDFYDYLTKPSASSQEPPIRPATADVYLRHAKLFLGWYVRVESTKPCDHKLSLFRLLPSKEKESGKILFDFIQWLRSERQISSSYEANVVRGLTKLVKFRFAEESLTDPSYGGKTFEDIPVVREMRKFHRDASQRYVV